MNHRSSQDHAPDLMTRLGGSVREVGARRAELQAAVGPAVEEVGVQLDLLDQHGASYVKRYIERNLNGEATPPRPRGMHRCIADALRCIALDEIYAVRHYGRATVRETA